MPIDPGTLGGYDIVLAISQEAVNRQLEALYLTEVDPPILNGPKYLIDHEMHFHQKFESGAFARWGIDGYVCCPKVDFGGGTIDDTDDVYRVARITFKFRKAEKDELSRKDREEGKLEDSVYRFLVIDGVDEETGMPKSRLEERIINGMEISWEAVVARKEIANVMNRKLDLQIVPVIPVTLLTALEKLSTRPPTRRAQSQSAKSYPMSSRSSSQQMFSEYQPSSVRLRVVVSLVHSPSSTQTENCSAPNQACQS